MNTKSFLKLFILFVGIGIFVSSVVIFKPVQAQMGTQQTPVPGRPISPHFSLPKVLTNQFSGTNLSAQSTYTHYVRLTDDTGSLSIEVPAEWTDIETGTWIVAGKEVGIYITAAPDLASFRASRTTAGVFFGASRDLASNRLVSTVVATNPAIGKLLSGERSAQQGRCQDGGRFVYQDNFYRGNYDLALNCALGSRGEIALVSMPPSQQFLVLLRIHIANQADMNAAAHILDTYQVLNSSLKGDDDEP